MIKTIEFVYYLLWSHCRSPLCMLPKCALGGADGADWLANLDCSFALVYRLVFADAAWLAT
jgi:hypothetical protein